IVGGGYHGKSTILRALERGVYPHIAGDGREWVIAEPTASSIRAEDGRAVTGDDISPFITNLPTGTDTRFFTTTNASGSTSQAANLVEALETGARTLLIDEDTSATNFMIRDDRMRALIPAEREPITPFVSRVRPLLTERGVSTVLVAGGSSAFFEVADLVIALDAYVPADVTARARELVGAEDGAEPSVEAPDGVFAAAPARVPTAGALRPSSKTKSAKAKGLDTVQFGRSFIDLAALSQLIDGQQTGAIAEALEYLAEIFDGQTSITEALAEIDAMLDAQGIDGITGHRAHPGHLARPRAQEIAAALNRFRGLRLVAGDCLRPVDRAGPPPGDRDWPSAVVEAPCPGGGRLSRHQCAEPVGGDDEDHRADQQGRIDCREPQVGQPQAARGGGRRSEPAGLEALDSGPGASGGVEHQR